MRRIGIALFMVLTAGSASAHSWYTGTHDPLTGFECCGGGDCAPVPNEAVRELAGGFLYLPTGEFIPMSRVQRSHDWQFHRCVYKRDFLDLAKRKFSKGDTRCFFAPPGAT